MSDWIVVYDRYHRTELEECDSEQEARRFIEHGSDAGELYERAIFHIPTRNLIVVDPLGALPEPEKMKEWVINKLAEESRNVDPTPIMNGSACPDDHTRPIRGG